MNGFLKIFIVSLIILFISIINEKHNIDYLGSRPSFYQYIPIFFIRTIHLFSFILSAFYLFFFHGLGSEHERSIYLVYMLFIVITWYYFDCCWVSYIELLLYNPKHLDKIQTTFHPAFHPILNKYTTYFMYICGILTVITVSIVLYFYKSISVVYKILYYAIFLALFGYTNLKARIEKVYYDASINKELHTLRFCIPWFTKIYELLLL